jgi:hypothetical protein
MCVDCVLASPRIAQVDPGDGPPSEVVLSHLISITGRRKQFLTCTEKTARAKLERLRSARIIQGDQNITSRHAEVSTGLKDS